MNLHFLYSSLPLTLVLNTWAVCGQVMDESSTRPAGFVSQPAEPDRPHHERSNYLGKNSTLCVQAIITTIAMTFYSLRIYRPLSQCGHLYFTPFKLIVTKLRLDETIVWCHV